MLKTICLWLSLTPLWAQAQSGVLASEPWAFKLTPSFYATAQTRNAVDINLRANTGPHAMWIGQYQRGAEFQQTRAGYEYSVNFDWGQMVPSVQLASGGFVGGSLNLQIGQQVYAIVGLGRTNLRDYYNLNFDPNDAVTLGVGAHLANGHQVSVFTVQDDRLGTGQVITHGLWHWQASAQNRWSLDLAHKDGRSSTGEPRVAGHSVALTYGHGHTFVRLAYDEKVNFSANNQTRVSVGQQF